EWYQIIKEEIDNNRPIHYGISGHSIACDGYRDDGFGLYRYHLNYGWGNSYNTWFIFDNLSCPWVTGGICPVPDQDITYNIIPQTEPIIKAWGYLFSNTTSGSDLYLLPGDNADLDILIKNEGWDGTGMHVELVSLDPNIVVISQTISFGESILWNEIDTTESSFSISIDESSPNPYTAKLELQITGDNGYATFDTVSIFTGNVTGYTSNFETDTTGWAHVEKTRGYGDQWHYSDFDAFSGSNCWKFGGSGSDPYDPYTDGYLLSPWILLGDNSVLSFQHRMDAQGGEGWAADCGYVMISTTEDNTWKTISPKDGYPNFAASHNTLLLEEDDPCFSSNFDWKEELFDLSEFSGASRIVFRFTTDASVDLEGWYIDDFTITNSVCGDAEQDGLINILDIVFLINYKYKDGPAPFPLGIGDVNHDTEIDILDIVYLVNSVYKNGPEPEC
ncbi:MAG: hypothetical protein GY855_15015, partial [candidate division Zixibacteria bacterium]|nr:hypothetical protein [candidate division Zixibacteria bacterium]